jgi:hypothetical protein
VDCALLILKPSFIYQKGDANNEVTLTVRRSDLDYDKGAELGGFWPSLQILTEVALVATEKVELFTDGRIFGGTVSRPGKIVTFFVLQALSIYPPKSLFG